MNRNMFVRVMAALGGATLCALGLGALAETFARVQITAGLTKLLGAGTPLAVLATLLLAILLCTCGVCCLLMLSNKRAAKHTGFVMQKGENGVIGVSVKSIEGLVQTCVKQHDVVSSAEISVVERRDGIVILLNIEEAAGVNIPLVVGALQKQIKQYVSDCTGVDVHEVRVMVENSECVAVASPYSVQEPMGMTTAVPAAELQREADLVPVAEAVPEETVYEAVAAEETAVEEACPAEAVNAEEAAPIVQPMPVVMPVMPEYPEEEDDRPLHQRVFATEEEPVFVPAPPELMVEPVNKAEPEEEVLPEEPVEEPQEEQLGANAVLEVVEALTADPEAEVNEESQCLTDEEEPVKEEE